MAAYIYTFYKYDKIHTHTHMHTNIQLFLIFKVNTTYKQLIYLCVKLCQYDLIIFGKACHPFKQTELSQNTQV